MPRQIIVVDDHEDTAAVVAEMIRRLKYNALTIPSGPGLLQRLSRLNAACGIELIVTDLFMPEPDGFEIIRFARQNLTWIPVIGMSGGHEGMLDSMLAFGAAYVIEKPVNPLCLKEVIDKAMQRVPCPTKTKLS